MDVVCGELRHGVGHNREPPERPRSSERVVVIGGRARVYGGLDGARGAVLRGRDGWITELQLELGGADVVGKLYVSAELL